MGSLLTPQSREASEAPLLHVPSTHQGREEVQGQNRAL